MANNDDRTIPATPRRREAARREGLAPTAALPAWAATAGTAILLAPGWARATIPAAAEAVRMAALAAAGGDSGEAPWPLPPGVVLPTVWLVAAAGLAGLVVHSLCDGLAWQPARAGFDLRRIDPIRGLGRIFSRDTLTAIVGATAALVVMAVAVILAARPLVGLVSAGGGIDPAGAAESAWRAAAWLVAGSIVVAAAQWLSARRRFEKRIRMTPQELAEEAKDARSDPRVRLLHSERRRPQSTAGTS
jgi:flagellar biosynthetic protein FlhB